MAFRKQIGPMTHHACYGVRQMGIPDKGKCMFGLETVA